MLIQLRRVVYLLVVWQFCACAVQASSAGNEGSDVAAAINVLNASMVKADELLAEGRTCLSVLEEKIKTCGEKSLLARSVCEACGGAGRAGGGCKDAIERVNDAELAVEYTRQASRACMISYGNLEDQAKRLESARAYLSEELQTAGESNERQEREKLVEKGRRRFSEMNGLMGKIGKALLEAPKSMATARERIRAANLVMKENTCVGRDGSLSSDSGEVKRVVSTREWRGLVLEAVKDELREAERKEAQRIVEERKTEEQAVSEKVEGDRVARESARREREEQEKRERAKQEEERKTAEEKSRKATEEEKAGKAKEEETKTLAEEAERSAKVEEARIAGEAVNKTKEKNKDGSSSPALSHSPLLLLVLLCVLGCTLVC